MSKLMGKYTHAAVLRLHGVIPDPVTGITNLHTAQGIVSGPIKPDIVIVGIPAMAPDRVGALCTTTGFLSFPGMDSLEMINITIGLIKIPIAIVVITIPYIKS